MDLSGEAFVQASQSEHVVPVVGPHNELLLIAKKLLSLKSDFFEKHLSKPSVDKVVLPSIGVAVCKLIVRWCYYVSRRPNYPALALILNLCKGAAPAHRSQG